uniref:Pru domain-containing protein n=1 Tax=Zooxanthella nutricula TaxID=1333877 RepID=A0A7S2KTS2_9DINO
MALFQQPVRPNGLVHVEFRAGRMDWDGKKVTADKRKGKVILFTSEEEQLMHFQWLDREKGEVSLDLIVINDAYFERIEKVKDGRVYILRFTSSDKKLFFWMQEPKTEGDEEMIKKFNEATGASIPDKKAGGAGATSSPAAPASAGAAAAGAAGAGTAVDPQLSAILQQFLDSQGAQSQRTPPLPMTDVLTTEVLSGLGSDEAAIAEMTPLLPESHRSPEGVREALSSPMLQQSLRALTQAVHSDQLPLLFTSLGLDPSAIASAAPGTDALELLCKAMENKYKK